MALTACVVGGAGPQARTEALLRLLLSPAAMPETGTPGCAFEPGVSSVGDDVLAALAQLAGHGRVESDCEPGDGLQHCRLTIGEAPPNSENVWSRNYQVAVTADLSALRGGVGCFTLP